MARKYVGASFATIDSEDGDNATVSLVGSHLQNICVEVEAGYSELSFIVSPVGARKMIAALEAALEASKLATSPQ